MINLFPLSKSMMAQALTTSRKRVRSNNCEEECCDFMPLSKRINNLHINNGTCCNGMGHAIPKHSDFKQEVMFEECQTEDGNLLGRSAESLHMPFSVDQGNNFMQLGLNPPGDHIHPHCNSTSSESSQSAAHAWMTDQILSLYSPDLDASDNPHYYENNKLLFALYMERMQRCGSELY